MSTESLKDEAEVLARVERIRQLADDDESAHAEEDTLHHQVLALIADEKCPDPSRWAELALRTEDIEFARWCA